MQTDFEAIQSMVDSTDLSEADKTYIKTCLWTGEEVAPITSKSEYEAYKRLAEELRKTLPPRSSPEWGQALLAFTRSRDGILAISIGARMIEWEERGGSE